MRKSFEGVMAIIWDTRQMDPFANVVYLFFGRRYNTLKSLCFDKDGFVILKKGWTTAVSNGSGMDQK